MTRLRVRPDGTGLEVISLSDEGSSVPRHEADAEVARAKGSRTLRCPACLGEGGGEAHGEAHGEVWDPCTFCRGKGRLNQTGVDALYARYVTERDK